eukprot:EG_transcript_391
MGHGRENPYHLRPVLGHKLPVQRAYQKPIVLYNPHDQLLKLKEIYTSESFLLLSFPDLPQGNNKVAQGKSWEIPPHQSKTVILLNFRGQQPGKYQGFIHIKSNLENFTVFMEFIVSQSGVHRMTEELDFGTIISPSSGSRRTIALMNSSPYPVLLKDAYTASPDPAMRIDFRPVILDKDTAVAVANVTYRGLKEGPFGGKVILHTNDTAPSSATVEIPYHGRVVHGALRYWSRNTTFHTVPEPSLPASPAERSLVVWNTFHVPLLFRSVTTNSTSFAVVDFVPGTVLNPNETQPLLSIRLQPNSTDQCRSSVLRFDTNVTKLHIPLACYNGRLHYVPSSILTTSATEAASPSFVDSSTASVRTATGFRSNRMEFGVVTLNKPHYFNFSLGNPNPVPVVVRDWQTSIQKLSVRHASGSLESTGSRRLVLRPGQSEAFSAELKASEEAERWGTVNFTTDHQPLRIDVHYVALAGALQFTTQSPSQGWLRGPPQRRGISVTSTFAQPIRLTSTASSDRRFLFSLTQPTVLPGAVTNIGSFVFDSSLANQSPSLDCHPTSTVPQSPTVSTNLFPPLTEHDFEAYKARPDTHNKVDHAMPEVITATLTFTTNISTQYTVAVQGTITRPHLATVPAVDFDMVHIGTSSVKFIPVHNPFDTPLALQLYSSQDLRGLQENILLLHTTNGGHVSLEDLEVVADEPPPFFVPVKGATRSVVLAPGQAGQVGPVVFRPSAAGPRRAVLLLRSNASVLEAVRVVGEGGEGRLVFQTGAAQIEQLHLHVQPSMLAPYINRTASFVPLSGLLKAFRSPTASSTDLVFRTPFALANAGTLSVDVRSFRIAGRACTAYGVAVEPCEAAVLAAGERRAMWLTVRPDFSTSLLAVSLTVETASLGAVHLPVEVSLPHGLLAPLRDTVPQPPAAHALRGAALMLSVVLALYSCQALYFNFYCVDLAQLLRMDCGPEGRTRRPTKGAPAADLDAGHRSERLSSATSSPTQSSHGSFERLGTIDAELVADARGPDSEVERHRFLLSAEAIPEEEVAREVTSGNPSETSSQRKSSGSPPPGDLLVELESPSRTVTPATPVTLALSDAASDPSAGRPSSDAGPEAALQSRPGSGEQDRERAPERKEAEKRERERERREREAADRERREQERRERERREKERREREKRERERREREDRERREKERRDREERERRERERREKEERERKEREEAEREKERLLEAERERREKESERENEREKEKMRAQEKEREKERQRERHRELQRQREREQRQREAEQREQAQPGREAEPERLRQEQREAEEELLERQWQAQEAAEESQRQQQRQEENERAREAQEQREREQREQRQHAQMALFERLQQRLKDQQRCQPGPALALDYEYDVLLQPAPVP